MKKNNKLLYALIISMALPLIVFSAGNFIPSDAAIKSDGFGSLATMINNFLVWFKNISVTIAAITFSIGGAKILLNPGNEKAVTEGKEVLKKTAIGMLIILGAWLLIKIIISTLVTAESTKALRFLN